jgi:Tol biopolymer transport system component
MKDTTIVGQKTPVTKHIKLLTGSTTDKYPVVLDNGKTIIFISDRSKEAETRLKYQMRGQHSNLNTK